MKDEQFKVLKTMSEAKNRMDINVFAQKVNLNPDETIHQVQELAKEGYLQKIGHGFGITEKGKAALRAFVPVQKEMSFQFYYNIGEPTELNTKTIEEFYRAIKEVSADSLEFHLYRGDFENWIKEVFKEPELADEISAIKAAGSKGEELRTELLRVIDTEYGIKELL